MRGRKEYRIAEEVRFELTIPFGMAVFETAALDHYATPPSEKLYHFLPNTPKNRMMSSLFRLGKEGPIV